MADGKSVNDDVAIERELPVKLTEEDRLARGESMKTAELKIEQLKKARKHTNALIQEQVDLRNKLAHVLDAGEENRTIICKWVAFDRENRWSLVRQDTGEEVESKAMTAGDKQEGLNFDAEPVDVSKPLPESKRAKLAAAMKAKPPRKPAPKKVARKTKR